MASCVPYFIHKRGYFFSEDVINFQAYEGSFRNREPNARCGIERIRIVLAKPECLWHFRIPVDSRESVNDILPQPSRVGAEYLESQDKHFTVCPKQNLSDSIHLRRRVRGEFFRMDAISV